MTESRHPEHQDLSEKSKYRTCEGTIAMDSKIEVDHG